MTNHLHKLIRVLSSPFGQISIYNLTPSISSSSSSSPQWTFSLNQAVSTPNCPSFVWTKLTLPCKLRTLHNPKGVLLWRLWTGHYHWSRNFHRRQCRQRTDLSWPCSNCTWQTQPGDFKSWWSKSNQWSWAQCFKVFCTVHKWPEERSCIGGHGKFDWK